MAGLDLREKDNCEERRGERRGGGVGGWEMGRRGGRWGEGVDRGGEEEGREGKEWGGERREGTHFLALLLLSSDLLLQGCNHSLVCLGPEHLVWLPACSKVCTLHMEEDNRHCAITKYCLYMHTLRIRTTR